MFASLDVVNEPFLYVVDFEAVFLTQIALQLALVFSLELLLVAVVDGRLVKMVFSEAVILASVDETLEDWEPASEVGEHLVEA